MMINKIVETRLDEPEDFAQKIPLWLRERTDGKQLPCRESSSLPSAFSSFTSLPATNFTGR